MAASKKPFKLWLKEKLKATGAFGALGFIVSITVLFSTSTEDVRAGAFLCALASGALAGASFFLASKLKPKKGRWSVGGEFEDWRM